MGHALGEEALASGGARGPPRELKSAIVIMTDPAAHG